jgi:hypothetical protein
LTGLQRIGDERHSRVWGFDNQDLVISREFCSTASNLTWSIESILPLIEPSDTNSSTVRIMSFSLIPNAEAMVAILTEENGSTYCTIERVLISLPREEA